MAGPVLRSCCLLLLPLLLCRPAAAVVPHRVANVTSSHVHQAYFSAWQPAMTATWQPPMTAMTAWLQPPLLWPALPSPEPRTFLFFENRTPMGRLIPGLARNSRCCGIENFGTRIAGGTPANRNQYPWMAAMVLTGTDDPFCGGSLVNNQYVVTAGHCTVGRLSVNVEVILGKHETNQNSGNDLRFAIQEIINHPSYDDTTLQNDIALLKLANVLTLPIQDNLIAPICMPTRGTYNRKIVLVAGWGVTKEDGSSPDKLHTVTLRTISNGRCNNLLQGIPTRVTANMICAGPWDISAGGKDACQGDSGGPLILRPWWTRKSLVGVVSWGRGCAQPNAPGVYARVTYFLDWLIDNMPDATYC